MPSSAVAYARQNHPRFLNELKDLLRIPSVSTLPEHKGDCHRAAEVLAAELTRIGMENARLIEGEGHPLVYADWLHAAGKPTALFYGHYDVQPTDPLDEWLSPPFEPTERNGNVYARGAVEDRCGRRSRRSNRCWLRRARCRSTSVSFSKAKRRSVGRQLRPLSPPSRPS
jgi:acetylornithine deacetylase/succinyl-diaminopimelate desuccinylase-like protein